MNIFLLCIKIFFARILDVSIGTVRTVVVIKNKKILSTILAFIEIFIWFTIAKEALNNDITNIWVALSYASGYATGTLIGMTLVDKFVNGFVGATVITTKKIVNKIKTNNYAVSVIPLKNTNNIKKEMLYIELKNNRINNFINLIKELDKNAFIVINDTRFVQNGFIK